MPNNAHRFREVVLPRGDQESALAQLRQEIVKAQAAEDGGQRRQGSRSVAAAKAREFDKLKEQAEQDAAKVVVYALAYDEFGPLQDKHAPRGGDALDKRVGYNRKTFPHALLKASLVEPETAADLDDLIAKGDAAFAGLGRLPQVQYARIEAAAWDVNVGDDSLPPFSAVSLLKQAREPDSRQQPATE